MTTHVLGQAAPTACPLTLSALRRNLLAIVAGNDLFTDGEQVLINHNAHECACPVRLALWCRNTRRVAADRDHARTQQTLAGMEQGIARFNARVAAAEQQAALAAKLAVACPTASQCDELHQLSLHPALTAAERAQTRLLWPSFTHATATAYIGKMWVRVLRRGGRLPKGVVATING